MQTYASKQSKRLPCDGKGSLSMAPYKAVAALQRSGMLKDEPVGWVLEAVPSLTQFKKWPS